MARFVFAPKLMYRLVLKLPASSKIQGMPKLSGNFQHNLPGVVCRQEMTTIFATNASAVRGFKKQCSKGQELKKSYQSQ